MICKITPAEQKSVLKDFENKKENLKAKKYTSVLSEAQRSFTMQKTTKIKNNIALVANSMMQLCIEAINKNLQLADVATQKVIKISAKNKITYLFIIDYIVNEKLTIQFFSNNILFERSISFHNLQNQATKIVYQEKILADKIIYGMLATIEKKRYIKLQLNIFNWQILQLNYKLLLLSKKQLLNYEKICSKHQSRILKYQNFKIGNH